LSNTRLVASALVGLVHSLLERALACCKRVCHVRNRLDLLGLDHDLDHLANLNLDERAPRVVCSERNWEYYSSTITG